MERQYPRVTITEKGERSVRGGHPWVYGDEVTGVEGAYVGGDIVDVFSRKNRYLGSGYINDASKIRVRLLSTNANDRFDEGFFRRRLQYALDYRFTVMGDDVSCCRLIFGESDGFPGLTVDRFEDVLVAQILSLGTERRRDMILGLLVSLLREKGVSIRVVYLRNDSAIRSKEGMTPYCGYFSAPGLETAGDGLVTITENGIRYTVDYINGQKTGFFLDQKYNRRAIQRIASGRHVLDCFTHTGAFALNAALGGAERVCAVDISEGALAMTRANAAQNGLEDRMDFLCCDVFDLLTRMAEEKNCPYDFIILDPPAFTKSHATVANATKGYKEINLKAMRLLPRGGYLATCSCSHFMTDDLFRKMLESAARDAQVQLKQVEARQQAPDHPIMLNIPETDYLKFYIFQVI